MGSGPKQKAARKEPKPVSRGISEPRSIFDTTFDTDTVATPRRAPAAAKTPARPKPDSKSAQTIWGSILD